MIFRGNRWCIFLSTPLEVRNACALDYAATVPSREHQYKFQSIFANDSSLPKNKPHTLSRCSALSITDETTITTAIVTFKHKNPNGIVRYEAFVDSLNGRKCSVAANAKPLQCTLTGIPEAVNFYIIARACFAGQDTCEPPIDVLTRTKLRGKRL